MTPLEGALTGVALAAAAGFRTFLPLLAAGILMRVTEFPAPEALSWASTDGGLLVLGVATLLEVGADKIPLLDNALDLAHTVLRPAAGLLLTVGFAGELSPAAAWTLGILVGAPTALGVHSARAATRGASTGLTGGAANPLLSLLDDAAAVLLVGLAFLVPLLAIALVLLAGAWFLRRWRRRRRRRAAARGPGPP